MPRTCYSPSQKQTSSAPLTENTRIPTLTSGRMRVEQKQEGPGLLLSLGWASIREVELGANIDEAEDEVIEDDGGDIRQSPCYEHIVPVLGVVLLGVCPG